MRPGFQIYHKDMAAITDMTDRELGELLRALYAVSLGEETEPPKRNKYVFNIMAQHIRDDAAAYEEKVEKTRRAANARHHANACERMQTHADASERTQYNPIQSNTIQSNSNNNNNPALNYSQRDDELNDVLMEV